jgi:hypothetical protein
MRTGSWLAYGEILHNSAIGAARFLNKATMRPHAVRIATTGKDVMIEIIGRGLTTGTTDPGLIMTTNKGIMLVARSRSRITRLGLIGLIPDGPTHDGTNDMRRALPA